MTKLFKVIVELYELLITSRKDPFGSGSINRVAENRRPDCDSGCAAVGH
jgi:hypothetical protein